MEVISETDTAFGRSHLLAITTKGTPASSGSESNLGDNQRAKGGGEREGGREKETREEERDAGKET